MSSTEKQARRYSNLLRGLLLSSQPGFTADPQANPVPESTGTALTILHVYMLYYSILIMTILLLLGLLFDVLYYVMLYTIVMYVLPSFKEACDINSAIEFKH